MWKTILGVLLACLFTLLPFMFGIIGFILVGIGFVLLAGNMMWQHFYGKKERKVAQDVTWYFTVLFCTCILIFATCFLPVLIRGF